VECDKTGLKGEAVNNSIAAYTANNAASVWGPFVQKLGWTWPTKPASALSLTHSDRKLVHVAGRRSKAGSWSYPGMLGRVVLFATNVFDAHKPIVKSTARRDGTNDCNQEHVIQFFNPAAQ
jgi:hypothetical protein